MYPFSIHSLRNCAIALVTLVLAFALPLDAHAATPVTAEEAYEIGMEAYVYLYPLVTFDLTRRVMTNRPSDEQPGMSPTNVFQHLRKYPTAQFRDVVRPNFDTLYSLAWLDLTHGPLIVSVPDTHGRYYLMPVLDMWTDVFAVPGKRTTGTAAARFAIVPPGWHGQLPQGVQRIDAPTPYVQVAGRTQTNGPGDYDAVHRIQDGYTITKLDGGSAALPLKVDPSVDMKTPPLLQVNAMSAANFLAYGAQLIAVNPPHLTDWSILARMKRIGIEPGKRFDFDALPPQVQGSLAHVPADARKMMKQRLPTMARVANGWLMNTDTMGVYGNYYLKRAIVAMVGVGANPAEDSVYPLNVADSNGKPLDGVHDYVMHFEKGALPPVEAFWSITLYDHDGFPVANPIDRYAIGDRDALKFNEDGSLDIYIQHESPGKDKESNWLPAPATSMNLTMRLYAPKQAVLEGRWNPPPVQRVK